VWYQKKKREIPGNERQNKTSAENSNQKNIIAEVHL